MPLLGSRGAASTTGFGALANLGYFLRNSLRFRSSNSAYLNRTMTTATNNLKWTWSGWVKRGTISDTNIVFGAGDGTSDNFGAMQFTTGDAIQYSQINSASYVVQVNTNAVFRDPSAWYHVVLVYDSPNATSTDRIQIYVNGTRQSVAYTTGPFAQNTSSKINSALAHYISKLDYASLYFDGYMAEVNFVDGQALTPSSFGKTDATTGQWVPKKFGGAYGTNGFYLPFTNTSSTSTLGNDFSGNGNTWTVNNISLTAGSTYDSMTDVPTLTNATTANYCVMNPLEVTNSTISNGNLTVAVSPTNGGITASSFVVASGKWYAEALFASTAGGNAISIGVAPGGTYLPSIFSVGVNYYADDGSKYVSGVNTSYGSSWTVNDTIGVALDVDGGTVTFYKNNVSQGAISLPTSTSGWKLILQNGGGSTVKTFNLTFGQRPFAYTPPSGFKALNTFNLP